MDKSFKETIVLNHSRYVEDYHLARLKVYELTPNLKYLLKPWTNLYGADNSSYRHFVSERYLHQLIHVIFHLKKNRNWTYTFKFLFPFKMLRKMNVSARLSDYFIGYSLNFIYQCFLFVKLIAQLIRLSLLTRINYTNKMLVYDAGKEALEESNGTIYNFSFFLSKKGFNVENLLSTSPSQLKRPNLKKYDVVKTKFTSEELRINLQFIFTGIELVLRGLLDLINGNKFSLVITEELLKSTFVKTYREQNLPSYVFFPIHSGLFLPPEIYQMKKSGSKVIQFEYSQSHKFPTIRKSKQHHSFYSLGAQESPYSSWSKEILGTEIWAYDEISKRFFENFTGTSVDIQKVSSIPYEDVEKILPDIKPKPKVAIFGIHAQEDYKKDLYGNIKVLNKFYKDINESLLKNDLIAYLKTTKHIKPKEGRKLATFSSNGFIEIQGISPKRIIESVDLVICFPFTSPAFEAHDQRKQVLFYDPISILDESHEITRGIKLIKGLNNLNEELKVFKDE